jgi:hypothetical protein
MGKKVKSVVSQSVVVALVIGALVGYLVGNGGFFNLLQGSVVDSTMKGDSVDLDSADSVTKTKTSRVLIAPMSPARIECDNLCLDTYNRMKGWGVPDAVVLPYILACREVCEFL